MIENKSQASYHKIKSLEVKGGFLDGMKVEFNDNLNCIIGGRGTGKTTVIEFIRADISLDKGILFNAEIYSQNEIEEIANDPYYQLNLIDKFTAGDISEIEKEIRITTRNLDQNVLEILQLHKDIDTLKEQLLELPAITEKLKGIKVEESEGAKEIQTGSKLKDESEKRVKIVNQKLVDSLEALRSIKDILQTNKQES